MQLRPDVNRNKAEVIDMSSIIEAWDYNHFIFKSREESDKALSS
jgi:hypothetical protein